MFTLETDQGRGAWKHRCSNSVKRETFALSAADDIPSLGSSHSTV